MALVSALLMQNACGTPQGHSPDARGNVVLGDGRRPGAQHGSHRRLENRVLAIVLHVCVPARRIVFPAWLATAATNSCHGLAGRGFRTAVRGDDDQLHPRPVADHSCQHAGRRKHFTLRGRPVRAPFSGRESRAAHLAGDDRGNRGHRDDVLRRADRRRMGGQPDRVVHPRRLWRQRRHPAQASRGRRHGALRSCLPASSRC